MNHNIINLCPGSNAIIPTHTDVADWIHYTAAKAVCNQWRFYGWGHGKPWPPEFELALRWLHFLYTRPKTCHILLGYLFHKSCKLTTVILLLTYTLSLCPIHVYVGRKIPIPTFWALETPSSVRRKLCRYAIEMPTKCCSGTHRIHRHLPDTRSLHTCWLDWRAQPLNALDDTGSCPSCLQHKQILTTL